MANTKYPLQISNTVLVKNGKTVQSTLAQNVKMTAADKNKLFDFSVTNGNGESSNLISITKIGDESFIRLSNLELLTDSAGATLSSNAELKAIFDNGGLKIAKDSGAIEMSHSGDELIINVNATDGKPYTFKIGATSVSLSYGGDDTESKYSFSTLSQNACIDVAMPRSTIEEMLANDSGIFKETKSARAIPGYLLGMYMDGMAEEAGEKNCAVKLGKFEICRCEFSDSDTSLPYYFVNHEKSKNKSDTLLFNNGSFVELSKDALIQHKEGSFGFVIANKKQSKAPKYWRIDMQVKDGKTSEAFAQGFEFLQEHTGIAPAASSATTQKGITVTASANGVEYPLVSHEQDERGYTEYKFDYRPKGYTVFKEAQSADEMYSHEGEDGMGAVVTPDDMESPDDTTTPSDENETTEPQPEGTEPPPSEDVADQNDSEPAADEDENDELAEQEELQKKREAAALANAEELEELEIEKKNEKAKKSQKKFHTIMGDTLATMGVFMMIASLIPGVNAIMAVVGLAVSAGGLLQSQFAGNLAFDPYRIANKKVAQAEAEQDAEQAERELFIERERELDIYHAQTLEKMSALDKMFYDDVENGGNVFAMEFARIFDEFGVGFLKESDETGMKQLQNIDMIQSRYALSQQLELIRNAHTDEERASELDKLEENFFQDMPSEYRAQLRGIFGAEYKDEFDKFMGALHDADTAQRVECDLYDMQRSYIASTSVNSLEYFSATDKFSEEQRLLYFERYGNAIIRNITVNHEGSTEQLENIIEAVPESSRQQAESILNESASALENKLAQVQTRAKENLAKHHEIDSLSNFHQLVVDVNNTQTATMDDCKAATEQYVKEYTIAAAIGARDKFIEDLLVDESVRPSDFTSATEQELFDKLNGFAKAVTQDDYLANSNLVNLQQFMFSKFEQSGLYDQMAEMYAESEKSGISSGGLLENPTKNKFDKAHSAQEIALRFAKEELISSIIKNRNLDEEAEAELRATLEKQSPAQVLQENFNVSKGKATLKNGSSVVEIEDNATQNAVSLVAAAALYQKEQAKSLVVPNIVKELANESSKEWYVRYDAQNDSFVCFDPNAELDDIQQKPEMMIDVAAQREKFAAMSPYFASLSKEQQTLLLQMKLGANMQKMRVNAEYKAAHPLTKEQMAAATGAFANEQVDQALLERVHVYALADKMVDAIIDGKIAAMMDEATITEALGAKADIDYKKQAETHGAELQQTLSRFAETQKLFEGLSTEEQKDLHEAVMGAVKNNSFPGKSQKEIYSILLQRQQGQKIVDGLEYNEEFRKNAENMKLVNDKGFNSLCEAVGLKDNEREDLISLMRSATNQDRHGQLRDSLKQVLVERGLQKQAVDNVVDAADFQRFIDDAVTAIDDKDNWYFADTKKSPSLQKRVEKLERLADERTGRNLAGVRFEYGRDFTDKEYKSQRKVEARDDGKEYEFDDYIDFFESRGLNREFLLSYYSKAKTAKRQEELTKKLLDKIGLSSEQYEKEKEKIKAQKSSSFKELTDSQKEYYKSARKAREFKENLDKYEQNIAGLQTAVFERQENETEEEFVERIAAIQEVIGKDVCKKLGINAKAYADIVNDSSLTEAEKHEKIDKLAEQDGTQANLELFKKMDELEKLDYVRQGQTKDDCAARAARFEKVHFEKQKKQLEGKLGRIADYLENNPDCLFVQDIFNALAEGNKEFFDSHPEIDMGEFGVSKLDLNLYDELGINMGKLVKDADKNIKASNVTAHNKGLIEKISKMTEKTKAKLEKESKAMIEKAKAKAEIATAGKDEKGSDEMAVKPAQAKTRLHLISGLLQYRKEMSAENQPPVHENSAAQNEKQNAAENENDNERE